MGAGNLLDMLSGSLASLNAGAECLRVCDIQGAKGHAKTLQSKKLFHKTF